jgi:hypothetical protein
MPLPENLGVSNLIFFLQDRPDFSGRSSSTSERPVNLSEEYLGCAALEAFLWLHLGVQVGYFSKQESRRVTYEYFPGLLQAYEKIQKNQMIQKFTPPFQRILQLEFGGNKELFSHNEGLAGGSEENIVPFQTMLILANGFANDPDTEEFCNALVFMNLATWNDRMNGLKLMSNPRSEEFIRARDGMSEMILKTVQYMECFRETLRDFDEVRKGVAGRDYSVLSDLKQQVKEIQSWRLNFAEQLVFERFFEFVDIVLMLSTRELAEGFRLQKTVTPELVRAIRLLTSEWGGPPMALEVGVH